ncbi:MAG: hypothetical protein ACRDHN_21410 [Thermomicrobiales bacterium]
MSRRVFTGIAAMNVAAGVAIACPRTEYARAFADEHAVKLIYAFAPIENGKLTSCTACRRHAANKRFASIQAARENRAHPGCTCAIYAIPVSKIEHARMFGDAVERMTYDLRSK